MIRQRRLPLDPQPGRLEFRFGLRLFVPFQRLHDHRSDTGIGLGLAIARGFTEAMGGTLEPAHTPGGGLTMTLTLPRAHGESPRREGDR